MSKGSLLCALVVLLQACVVLHLSPTASSGRLTGSSIGDVFQCQDPIRGSGLMLSRGPDDFDGANSDSIFDDELAGDDEYASDDGGTPLPGGAEAVMEEEEELVPSGDDDGGGKESSAELGSGGDVECPECGKFFRNDKSMFGHLRSHPNRGYKGATPPMKNLRMSSPETDAGSPAPSSPDIAGPSRQCSGRDPQLTPFEVLCACVMLTLRCRDGQATQQAPPPQPPSFAEGKIEAVEKIEGGVGELIASIAAADVKSEDPGPELGNGLLSDEHGGSIVKIPKKRRRSISKEDREANKKVKLMVTPKEKRPYVCKHCKAEFSTHQALGGHMAGHHRDKKIPAVNDKETSKAHQGTVGQGQNGKQAKGDCDESRCDGLSGLSLSSKRMQVELPMAPKPWLSGQTSGGHIRHHFVRRNDGQTSGAADGDRRRSLDIDLNVKAPDQD